MTSSLHGVNRARLINLLQMEFEVLPTKMLKEDKAEYIQALIDTREEENIDIFIDSMTELHCRHLKSDIDQYIKSTSEKMVDKTALTKKIVDKWCKMANYTFIDTTFDGLDECVIIDKI